MISHTVSQKKEISLCGKNIIVAGKKIKGLIIFLVERLFLEACSLECKKKAAINITMFNL